MTDCLFCGIIEGNVPATIVYEDADLVAFRDIQPQAPVHVLVVPRKHIPRFADLDEGNDALMGKLARAAARVAGQEGIQESGYRTIVNNGPDAQQSVLHLHLHVIGGRPMSWPPG
jgi:histidine triad (HIT) family protein